MGENMTKSRVPRYFREGVAVHEVLLIMIRDCKVGGLTSIRS